VLSTIWVRLPAALQSITCTFSLGGGKSDA
jgi:hypothetical protein